MISSLREPVTVAELKRHIDRRFNRLDRTKADKRDLRRFATKKDLQHFATKAELRREGRALRRDMRLWAVDIKRHFDVVAEGLEEKLQKVAEGVSEIPAIKLHLAHHDRVLDDHEARLTAVEPKA